MRAWQLLAVLLYCVFVSAGRVSAGEPEQMQISVAEILNSGLFETDRSAERTGATDRMIGADTVWGIRFTAETSMIPGRVGLNFGFEYSINTSPPGKRLAVKSVIRFPEPGLQAPDGRIWRESVEHKVIRIGEPALHGYGFDEAWEVVLGRWSFEIWHDKARLIRKTFTVVAEEPAVGGQPVPPPRESEGKGR